MSKTAEDVSASLSADAPTLEPVDAVAALLIAEDETAAPAVATEEPKAPTKSTTAEEEGNAEEEEQEAGEEQEETTLEAVAEEGDPTWESTLGVPEASMSFDEAGNIVGFKTKVNGEEQVIPTADLIAGFQNAKHTTQQNQAHAETVKEFDKQKEQVQQTYLSKLESVDALSKHFEKQLISDYEGVDWVQLRQDNPAEYAAMRQDYAVKAGELSNIQDAINTDKEASKKELDEGNLVKRRAYMKGQYDTMLVNNPSWSDEKVMTAARDGFKTFVQDTYGFGDGEWNMVNDARLIELIKDAKKYHDGASVAAKKTLKPVPKFQQSRGKGVKPKVTKLQKLTAASKAASGGEKRDLQASAVAELLLGGT